jgi:hypothetical protein
MKITASQLRTIIKEEVSKILLEHEHAIERRGDELYIVDDEGNERFYDDVAGSNYEFLEDGERVPYEGGRSYGGYGRGGYSRGGYRSRY